MSARIPPLNPLRVFDAAAQSSSFTEAAEELMVTQAAVSRQISTLEGYFGCKLFDREQRSLTLTPEGRRLHREIGPAFEMIAQVTGEILHKKDPNTVTIQAYPTVIAQRLLPRLDELLGAHQGMEVNFVNGIRPSEFSFDLADIVICYYQEEPDDVEERDFKLAYDRIKPAATPELVDRFGGSKKALEQAPLIMTKFRHSDWLDWSDQVGLDIQGRKRLNFDSSLLGYQAALSSVGICIAQEFILGDDLAAGKMVALSETAFTRDSYYWCRVSPRRKTNRPLKVTLDWLESMQTDEAR